MNQVELQKMAEERLKDAKVLLDGGRWEFAYYAAGYVVECGLKSCILARMIHTGWVFEEKWDARVCRQHDFAELVRVAGLNGLLIEYQKENAAKGGLFASNWETAAKWTVTSRYEPRAEAEARGLYSAIADEEH